MKKFKICVTTTFNKWYEIEADTEESALEDLVDCLDDATDTDDFETEITAINKVK